MAPSIGVQPSVNLEPVLDAISQLADAQVSYGKAIAELARNQANHGKAIAKLDQNMQTGFQKMDGQFSSVEKRLDDMDQTLKELVAAVKIANGAGSNGYAA